MPTVPTFIIRLGVLALVFVAGCGSGEDAPNIAALPVKAPQGWGPVLAVTRGPWSNDEAELLNATLYFVRETFRPDDPRRQLLETARYVPLDAMDPEDGTKPADVEAVFSVRTGNVYVGRPTTDRFPELASSLAHELHHLERDHTPSINRMQECDRERVAHAREAEDIERMIAAVPTGSPSATGWLHAFELGRAKAKSLSAMYASKFELFRVVQALDRVDGLRELPALYSGYERCIEVAQKALATEHREELTLLDDLSASAHGTAAEPAIAGALRRAREAVEACAPLDAEVVRLRAAERPRAKR